MSKDPKKLKVCIIATKLELGGAQKVALYLAENLPAYGYETVVLCGKGGILDEKLLSSKIRHFFIPALLRQINPVNDLLAFFQILKILKAEKPDIVHTHSSKAGIIGRVAAWFAGIKVKIHTIHGFGFNDFQNHLLRLILVAAERFIAPITDKFIAVSNENIKKGLANSIGSPGQYVVIRAGIDLERFKNTKADRQKYLRSFNLTGNEKIITTIGPFKPQKNLADFIRAAKIVSESRKDAGFLIIGDGQQRNMLEGLINGFGIKDKVLLAGWREDIPEILSLTDLFVLTSLWEGLPCTVVEAMAAGVPVIANAVDGVNEIIRDGENGFLVEPRNFGKTAAIILDLLSNPDKARTAALKGKNSVAAEYDLKTMLKQHAGLYAQLIIEKIN